MAETVGPSVRGAQRVLIVALLGASAALTGALAGFAAGGLWALADLPAIGTGAAAALAVIATGADLVRVTTGRLRPWSSARQVPQLWGRLFGPGTVALLYGSRLGVAPLTIVSTWLWWAAAVIATTLGPSWAAGCGALFGAARVATMHAAVTGGQPRMAQRMAAVSRAERRVAVLIAIVLAALAVSACTSHDDDARAPLTTRAAPSTTRAPTAMAPLLLTDPFPGFDVDPDAPGTGALDLEAAARAEVDPTGERSLLRTRGFREGEGRRWRNADGDTVLIVLYEFGDAAGAAAYLGDGREIALARDVQPFAVPQIAGAFGFSGVDDTASGAFAAHAVAFTHGPRYVLVVTGGQTSARTPDDAISVAVRQHARL